MKHIPGADTANFPCHFWHRGGVLLYYPTQTLTPVHCHKKPVWNIFLLPSPGVVEISPPLSGGAGNFIPCIGVSEWDGTWKQPFTKGVSGLYGLETATSNGHRRRKSDTMGREVGAQDWLCRQAPVFFCGGLVLCAEEWQFQTFSFLGGTNRLPSF